MSGSRARVSQVLRSVTAANCRCPAHSQAFGGYRVLHPKEPVSGLRGRVANSSGMIPEKEYAFEMTTSTIRYGPGVSREIGMDVQNLGIKNLCVLTDKNVAQLPPLKSVLNSLQTNQVTHAVFDDVSIEPTNVSIEKAISFARENDFDGFVAVGGGSVMDTAKATNLMTCHPDKELIDFVNAPIGRGEVPQHSLKPLICVPTTSGTGSETTGVSVFDHQDIGMKIGIGCRQIRPLLGLVDPLHVKHMPRNVAVYSGFDVLCHALESYTALPYYEREPRPPNPAKRPAYQGSNPISDLWSLHAIRIISKYFKRSVFDAEDAEARAAMHLASTYAGVGFGNAGCHLCHGMSYAISFNSHSMAFSADGYDKSKSLIPHGLSVVVTAPAVFTFTAPLCPERHLEAAQILGADISKAKLSDAGHILSDTLREYMEATGVANGLKELGFSNEDVPKLVQETLPQERVTKLSPRRFTEEELAKLFEDSMEVYK